MILTDKKIVVTGGTGLVGSHLVAELLSHGCDVLLLVREESRFDRLNATLERMGVADRASRIKHQVVALNNPLELTDALQGADVVFHCAASVSFDPQDEAGIVSINAEMALQVSEACLACRVGLLVYVSSIAALGDAALSTGVVTEACELSNLEGRSAYSVSKFYAENTVRRAAIRGLRTIIVNPSVVLGEGDWRHGSGLLMASLVRWGRWGYPPGVKGYVDVRDVARAMVLLAAKDEAVGRRFIVSGGNLSFKELQTEIAGALGRKPPFVPVGRGVLMLAAQAGELVSRLGYGGLRVSEALVANAADRTYYDGSLLSRTTGLQYTPLEETIRRVVTAYRNDQKNTI